MFKLFTDFASHLNTLMVRVHVRIPYFDFIFTTWIFGIVSQKWRETLGRILFWMPGIVPTAVDFPDEGNVLQGEWPWYGKVPPLNMVHHLPAFPHQLSPWWDGSWQAHGEGRSTLRRQTGASAPLENLSLSSLCLLVTATWAKHFCSCSHQRKQG